MLKKMIKNLLGVVLVGGFSSRMGRDKGLLEKDGCAWVNKALGLFDQLKLPAVLSLRMEQMENYKKHCPPREMVPDLNITDGPLRGILSVHAKYPNSDLLILATDMICMNTNPLKVLLRYHQKYMDDLDCIVFENGSRLEPLCAVYKKNFLKNILNKEEHGFLEHYSLNRIFSNREFRVFQILAGKEMKECFRNFNDLASVSELEGVNNA
jgi:molybdenum cofactor guanylyltransferase